MQQHFVRFHPASSVSGSHPPEPPPPLPHSTTASTQPSYPQPHASPWPHDFQLQPPKSLFAGPHHHDALYAAPHPPANQQIQGSFSLSSSSTPFATSSTSHYRSIAPAPPPSFTPFPFVPYPPPFVLYSSATGTPGTVSDPSFLLSSSSSLSSCAPYPLSYSILPTLTPPSQSHTSLDPPLHLSSYPIPNVKASTAPAPAVVPDSHESLSFVNLQRPPLPESLPKTKPAPSSPPPPPKRRGRPSQGARMNPHDISPSNIMPSRNRVRRQRTIVNYSTAGSSGTSTTHNSSGEETDAPVYSEPESQLAVGLNVSETTELEGPGSAPEETVPPGGAPRPAFDMSTLPVTYLRRYQAYLERASPYPSPRRGSHSPRTSSDRDSTTADYIRRCPDYANQLLLGTGALAGDTQPRGHDFTTTPMAASTAQSLAGGERGKLVESCWAHYNRMEVNEKEILPWFVYTIRNRNRVLKLTPPPMRCPVDADAEAC